MNAEAAARAGIVILAVPLAAQIPTLRRVPDGVAVVAAFHCLSAHSLAQLDQTVDCDVLICGDSAEAKAAVADLVEKIPGARAVEAGPLENAHLVENLAALLIALNLRHKVKGSGVRITGLK